MGIAFIPKRGYHLHDEVTERWLVVHDENPFSRAKSARVFIPQLGNTERCGEVSRHGGKTLSEGEK